MPVQPSPVLKICISNPPKPGPDLYYWRFNQLELVFKNDFTSQNSYFNDSTSWKSSKNDSTSRKPSWTAQYPFSVYLHLRLPDKSRRFRQASDRNPSKPIETHRNLSKSKGFDFCQNGIRVLPRNLIICIKKIISGHNWRVKPFRSPKLLIFQVLSKL